MFVTGYESVASSVHFALYLLSEMSRGVTGEVHHVDSGYHVVGMKRPDAPDISLSNSAKE